MAAPKDRLANRARDMVRSVGQFKLSERSEMARRWMAARRRMGSQVAIWGLAPTDAATGEAEDSFRAIPESQQQDGHQLMAALEEEGLVRPRDLREGGLADAGEWAAHARGRVAFDLGATGSNAQRDVAASITGLRDRGFSAPIAIIDLDCHEGNGNRARFGTDPSVLTYALQEPLHSPPPALADVLVEVPPGTQGGEYLSVLRKTLLPAMRAHAPELIYYVAGRNLLGGPTLDAFQLSERGVFLCDQLILELSADLQASCVVRLNGAASPRSWQCSARILRWTLTDSIEALG